MATRVGVRRRKNRNQPIVIPSLFMMPALSFTLHLEGWEAWGIGLIFLAGITFFVGMWLAVTFLISRFGWAGFAKRYRSAERPSGKSFHAAHLRFRLFLASYRNAVKVVPTEAGLHVRTISLLRAFHDPFLIPWSSVRRIEQRRGWLLGGSFVEVEDPAGKIRLMLPQSFATRAAEFPDAPRPVSA
jgi:hypothetical protein